MFKRVLWPERASFFAIIGGAIGLSGDVTSFFSEFLNPYLLLALFAAITFLAGYPCFKMAAKLERLARKATLKNEEIDDVVHCTFCDAMRFSLFATFAFILLLLIGQGQSATEAVGEKLGLIHKDVQKISENVDTINTNVQGLSDMSQSARLIDNPHTAQDYFTNAWIYMNIQRNAQESYNAALKMYDNAAPRKLDAAELLFNAGRQLKERDALMQEIEAIADRTRDSTLLVIAGRNAATPDESERLYQKAQEIEPDQPFAYWDIMAFSGSMGATPVDVESQRAALEKQIAGLEKFINLINGKPAAFFFYLPQYQADHEMVARQTLGGLKAAMSNYERIDNMKEERDRLKADHDAKMKELQNK